MRPVARMPQVVVTPLLQPESTTRRKRMTRL
jgi:hypothetical protein